MKTKSAKFLLSIFLIVSTGSFLQAHKEIDYTAECGKIQFNIFDFEGSEKYDSRYG